MMVVLILLHILICAFLILTVLLQSGKAGDLASAFGGAGSQTAFGTRSAASLLTGSSVMGDTTPVNSGTVTQSPDTKDQESATSVGSGAEVGASESDGADDKAEE